LPGALAGARDILAERIADDATARARLRELFATKASPEIERYSPAKKRRDRNSKLLRLERTRRHRAFSSNSRHSAR
jgi:transcriptional accessory protein Tex/SPT6